MKNTKTYYSVVYRNWGADSASRAWFDNKADAEKFAAHDFRDGVVAHRVSRHETIARYDELVNLTAVSFAD